MSAVQAAAPVMADHIVLAPALGEGGERHVRMLVVAPDGSKIAADFTAEDMIGFGWSVGKAIEGPGVVQQIINLGGRDAH